MNDNEKTRIAAAINQLRPDWPAASLRSLLDRPTLSERPRRDVAVALTWVACETESKTPARVLEAGPWWNAVAINGDTTGRREPWDPALACDTCGRRSHDDRDHPFETRRDADRRRAHEQPKERLPRMKETTDA